jgi:mannonate dehydratase
VAGKVDQDALGRLIELHKDFPPGARFMLLAFDYHYDENGHRHEERSAYHTPNTFARYVAQHFPERFEWIASVHPYRNDCVEVLEAVVESGARAIKWLPSAMGIDPAAPRCDRFYEALAKLGVPLLTHGGKELAVHGADTQHYGNPLKLRRALDHGVRVIVAHCASDGADIDLDRGAHGPEIESFQLFARLLDDPRYAGRLFGEISALPQVNRMGNPLTTLLQRSDWHPRLINGSDYPLVGVMPLISPRRLASHGYLNEREVDVLLDIRRYNPILFDFVLKRHLKVGRKRFDRQVFESRRLFVRTPKAK